MIIRTATAGCTLGAADWSRAGIPDALVAGRLGGLIYVTSSGDCTTAAEPAVYIVSFADDLCVAVANGTTRRGGNVT
jgi:hypothetical protein